ncbi:MAG: Fic family protein [Pseudonocardiaceae bacterium]|jgi:hypothetical protein|nr:Fic family protein [Pseudonocardiaceae bacterium]
MRIMMEECSPYLDEWPYGGLHESRPSDRDAAPPEELDRYHLRYHYHCRYGDDDAGLLESALARPQASMFGQDAYPSVWGKAGALVHSLVSNHAVSNHALVDGNKRLG